jgi:pentafunctional AROM polypeptide
VLDAALIRELIRAGTLTLTSGVIVLDFNHAAFHDAEGYEAKEYEVDLIRALGSVAKQLYEDVRLLSIYVNVQPEEEGVMSDDAKKRKRVIEDQILLPFLDYELCVKDEGSDQSSPAWGDGEWELQRMVARALLPPPVVGGTARDNPNNNADLTMGMNTFFLSLSFPKIEMAAPYHYYH